MPPSFATYQKAAQDIYEPQKAAEQASLTTEKTGAISTLEATKNPIQQDYQTAIDELKQSVLKQTGEINQLYTLRLGGNFSGLQGNDLGMMFSSANKQQTGIETTRANKLSDIALQEANVTNRYNTDIGNLGSKYQSLEAEYTNKGYGEAVKDYQTQQYRQEQLKLDYARLNSSNANAAASRALRASNAANKPLTSTQINAAIRSGLNSVRGGDGYVSPQDYARAFKDYTDSGLSAASFETNYGDLKNPNNPYYDYAIKQVK